MGVSGLADLEAGHLGLLVDLEPLGVDVGVAALHEDQIAALGLAEEALVETGEHGPEGAVRLGVLLLLFFEDVRLLLHAPVALLATPEGGLLGRSVAGKEGQDGEEREKTSHSFMLKRRLNKYNLICPSYFINSGFS